MVNPLTEKSLLRLSSVAQLRGRFSVPGDKSISHRSVILGALAEGTTTITGFLRSEDCMATLNIMKQLGVPIDDDGVSIRVHGVGLNGLKMATGDLDCGNAGTAMRLLSGVLAAQNFSSTLTGDESLSVRPMNRIIKPLTQMGAQITSDKGTAPLIFSAVGSLKPINYDSPIASAQVKSAILLAGLFAEGITTVTEPKKSRDHTETMLAGFGATIDVDGLKVAIKGKPQLKGQNIEVPGDVSSAAFFMVLALCHRDADIIVENVCINPTRVGVVHILKAMGGDIRFLHRRVIAGESVADIHIKSSRLKGIEVPNQWIPSAIDEFPAIFIAAAHADGLFQLTEAEELRHKESDRIAVMSQGLAIMGLSCKELPGGVVINGQGADWHPLGACLDGAGDHRCAMSFLVVSALHSETDMVVKGCHNIATSFPNFFKLMGQLSLFLEESVPVITIDGPSGVGKGTISSLTAKALGWHLLDSGSIYRAMALQAINMKLEPNDESQLVDAAKDLDLCFNVCEDGSSQVLLNQQPVTDQLRSESIGDMASKIASIADLRVALFSRQRAFQQQPGLVADGRDMGTIVFPSAPLKVFLTASVEERAKRRLKQLNDSGVDVRIRDLLNDIEARDLRDSSRKVAPLVPARDAHIIDTSGLSIEEVLSQVLTLARQFVV